MDYGHMIRNNIKTNFDNLKLNGRKFSVTLDEWTSQQNRRYMNVNVHSSAGRFWNLGLITIQGSFPALIWLELLQNKLSEFGLSLKEDIVSIVSDGASVMVKLGKISPTGNQLYIAHGIHLAVTDVLYKQNTCVIDTHIEEENDLEDDLDEDHVYGFEVGEDEQLINPLIHSGYVHLLNKVREVIKIFRKSPVKNNTILQPYVISEMNK